MSCCQRRNEREGGREGEREGERRERETERERERGGGGGGRGWAMFLGTILCALGRWAGGGVDAGNYELIGQPRVLGIIIMRSILGLV